MISEKWLPQLQKNFNVMPIHKCINEPHPYWEESWVYPTLDSPDPPRYHAISPPPSKFDPASDMAPSIAVSLGLNVLIAILLITAVSLL